MAEFIRDLPRFHEDCKKYQTVIEKLSTIDEARHRKLNSIYQDFLLKVESVDRSVQDMATGFVAVGMQHGTFVEALKEVRLRLDAEIKKVEKLLKND